MEASEKVVPLTGKIMAAVESCLAQNGACGLLDTSEGSPLWSEVYRQLNTSYVGLARLRELAKAGAK
jgi:hypothetical protein